MQTLLTVALVGGFAYLVLVFTAAGIGYVIQRCRRLISRLSERQHHSS